MCWLLSLCLHNIYFTCLHSYTDYFLGKCFPYFFCVCVCVREGEGWWWLAHTHKWAILSFIYLSKTSDDGQHWSNDILGQTIPNVDRETMTTGSQGRELYNRTIGAEHMSKRLSADHEICLHRSRCCRQRAADTGTPPDLCADVHRWTN